MWSMNTMSIHICEVWILCPFIYVKYEYYVHSYMWSMNTITSHIWMDIVFILHIYEWTWFSCWGNLWMGIPTLSNSSLKECHTVHSKCINDHTLRSDIFLPKCPTNLRVNTLSPTIWSDIVVGRESGYLKIFFTFLEVNMSNILWSMCICKRTFFPVCRMSRYVNTLVYFYLAPYSCQEDIL
jgi:hypothetical protein